MHMKNMEVVAMCFYATLSGYWSDYLNLQIENLHNMELYMLRLYIFSSFYSS